MSVYYLDTNVLVKYYVSEPGSAWVRQLVKDESNILTTAEIAIAEVSAALAMIVRLGRVSQRQRDEMWAKFRYDLVRRYELLPTHRAIINHAAELCRKYPLRGFDAIHLSSGFHLQDVLFKRAEKPMMTYVTGDAALLGAAQAESFKVENPFWHTDLDVSQSS